VVSLEALHMVPPEVLDRVPEVLRVVPLQAPELEVFLHKPYYSSPFTNKLNL
jgi:hypothetical protein